MNIGQAGIDLIKSYEKLRLKAYLPTPDDVWTIGWGHTGSDVVEGLVWTRERADEAFLEDTALVEKCVNGAVTLPLTQNEFDACCSLCFNIGCGAFKGSTLAKKLNASDLAGAEAEFKRWNRQAGKELAGLTRRRAQEAVLFETA